MLGLSFLRQLTVLVSGSVLAQLIGFAAIPLITRLYEPSAFGLFGAYTAFSAILIPVAALTLPAAIVLPLTTFQASRVYRTCVSVATLTAAICMLLLLFGLEVIANLFNLQEIKYWLLLIPFAMLFTAMTQMQQQWHIRFQQFPAIAKTQVAHAALVNTGKVTGGLISPVAGLLILTHMAGQAFQWLSLSVKAKKNGYAPVLQNITILRQWAVLKQYRQFVFYQAPQQFINTASQGIPILLVTMTFGAAAAGFYTLAKTVMAVPCGVIAKAVGDVMYPRMAKLDSSGQSLTKPLLKSTGGLLAVGIVPFAIVMMFGSVLFSWLFGSEWHQAGSLARWVALWMLFVFINPPALKAIMVLNIQHQALITNLITMPARLAAFYIVSYYTNTLELAVAAFCLVGVLHNCIIITLALAASIRNRHS